MKGVEFINSRAVEGRSQWSTDDYQPTSGTEDASEPTGVFPSLTHQESNAVLSVLRHFADTLKIYRFTLDNGTRRKSARQIVDDEDFDLNEKMIKICEDSSYVSNIFEDLIRDIETDGSYNVLIREIEDKRKRQDDEATVARNYEDARKRVAELRELVAEETKTNARDREVLKSQLIRSKNEKKRLELKVGIESRYVSAREKARREGSSLRFSITLKTLRDALEDLSSSEESESRVAREIEAFLNQNARTNEKATTQWQERYEREMQMYQSENGRLSDAIESRRQMLEGLQLEYRERQEFIERYIEEKVAALERKKREEHRRGCSIRIQAWWRGVMVRRKLGPYRADERKKKRAVKSKK